MRGFVFWIGLLFYSLSSVSAQDTGTSTPSPDDPIGGNPEDYGYRISGYGHRTSEPEYSISVSGGYAPSSIRYELELPGRINYGFAGYVIVPASGAFWSPDGTRMVFSIVEGPGGSGSGSDIYVFDIASGEATRLVAECGPCEWPVWSPDGQTIAFMGSWGVRSVPATGGGVRVVAMAPFTGVNGRRMLGHGFLQWSPDGQWLVFLIAEHQAEHEYPELWAVRPDGRNLQHVYTLDDSRYGGGEVAWSADGSRIVVQHNRYSIQIDASCLERGCTEDDASEYDGEIPNSWLPNFFPQWAGEIVPRPALTGITVSSDAVLILTEPSEEAQLVIAVNTGDTIYLLNHLTDDTSPHIVDGQEFTGDWFRVLTVAGWHGWISVNTLNLPVVTTENAINVRQGPSTNFNIQGVTDPALTYIVTGRNDSGYWIQIIFEGQPGWLYYSLTGGVDDLESLPVVE